MNQIEVTIQNTINVPDNINHWHQTPSHIQPLSKHPQSQSKPNTQLLINKYPPWQMLNITKASPKKYLSHLGSPSNSPRTALSFLPSKPHLVSLTSEVSAVWWAHFPSHRIRRLLQLISFVRMAASNVRSGSLLVSDFGMGGWRSVWKKSIAVE